MHGSSQTGLNAGYNLVYRSDGQRLLGSPMPDDLWNVNPLFVDATNNDFHLQVWSPAIDAGSILADVNDDFDGNYRPLGEGFDIGAYENPFLEVITIPIIISY